MTHPLDRPVGSDLSFLVLQRRVAARDTDVSRRVYPVTGYRRFVADPDMGQPDESGVVVDTVIHVRRIA